MRRVHTLLPTSSPGARGTSCPPAAPEPKSPLLLLPYIPAHPMPDLPHSSPKPCPQLWCAPAWHSKTPSPPLPGTLCSLGVLPAPAAAPHPRPHHTGAGAYQGLQHFLFPRSRFTEYKHKTRHQHRQPPQHPPAPRGCSPLFHWAPQCCPVPADPNSAPTLNPCAPRKHGREFHPSFLRLLFLPTAKHLFPSVGTSLSPPQRSAKISRAPWMSLAL